MAGPPILLAITDHLEGPAGRPSRQVYGEIASLTRAADAAGIDYFFYSEHHAHAHHGHCPAPLLFALHVASQTSRIRLGTGIICLNLHNPLAVAEQVAVADVLMNGRLSPGFGSGSTPEEYTLFGLCEPPEEQRHASFGRALGAIKAAWEGGSPPVGDCKPRLANRAFVAVNSPGSAAVAGRLDFHMLFSHLRTPAQHRAYVEAYRGAGGKGLVATNRPLYVAETDAGARRDLEPALRTLWRRFRREGKIPSSMAEPRNIEDLAAHPINFVFGSPESVAGQLAELHRQCPYDIGNFEVRWADLPCEHVHSCVQLLATKVRVRLNELIQPVTTTE